LISGGTDNLVRVWDAASMEAVHVLKGHTNFVNWVAVSADSAHVASASSDGTVRIWGLASGRPICAPLEGHTSQAAAVAYSSDGRWLASGGDDHAVIIWDAKEYTRLLTLSGHTGELYCLAFSPDNGRLASCASDGTFKIWDTTLFAPRPESQPAARTSP
jgi:WD40 repeat protein